MDNLQVGTGYIASIATATSTIVAEYLRAIGPLAASRLDSTELARITASVRRELIGDNPLETMEKVEIVADLPKPAVDPKKSVFPDHILSLEDGKPYKALKRHLRARGMTPAEYRDKWGLAPDYPMVAPSYAQRRSDLAKEMGLGISGHDRRSRSA